MALELEFLGAAREVTGSCYRLRAGRSRVLVDCGLIQGSARDEARNAQPFAFDPRHIDAVVLTHSHLDHSGRLPLLVKQGFRGSIYTHRASRDLCRVMLKDAGYLNEKDAEWANRKRLRKGLPLVAPLYSLGEAQAAMHYFRGLDYGVAQEVAPGITVRLQDAGHILGSAIVEVWLEDGGEQRKLVFSGDLGHRGAPILRDPVTVPEADLVVLESTYGDRSHRSWDATYAELADILRNSRPGHGKILIPAFAIGRTQELLYTFRRYYEDWGLDHWQIFLDSPMAIEATEIYARHADVYDREASAMRSNGGNPFALPNLHLSRTAQQSMRLNQIESGAIIIAGSGMCDGGRIKHHLKHNVWRSDCQILMVGFQAQGTPGRALVDGARYIRLWGETVRVAARVHTVGGLSAHADCEGLSDWYAQFRGRPPVALTHGEPSAIEPFAERLRALGAVSVHAPQRGERLDLHTMRWAPSDSDVDHRIDQRS